VNVALATEGGVAVELQQRRFFADPSAAATVGDGAATKWLVPVVLRFRDLKGVKEQAVLLREGSAHVKLEAEGLVSWCIGNADARGFYRTNYDDATLARLLPAVAELRPAERIGLISDQWALVRADQAPIERFLDLVVSLRGEEDIEVEHGTQPGDTLVLDADNGQIFVRPADDIRLLAGVPAEQRQAGDREGEP
jgi:puromycin-sensitive aminopeptidase